MYRVLTLLLVGCVCCMGGTFGGTAVAADTANRIMLPAPKTSGGMPLLDALSARRTTRAFDTQPVDESTLSTLLWAGWGFNRGTTHRTAPTAMNVQNVQIYVVWRQALWLYDAAANALVPAGPCPSMELLGRQNFVPKAAVTLLYAADLRMKRGAMQDADMPFYSALHVGSVYENVALCCAALGLNNVVRTGLDRAALDAAMQLPAHIRVIAAHSIGWPE